MNTMFCTNISIPSFYSILNVMYSLKIFSKSQSSPPFSSHFTLTIGRCSSAVEFQFPLGNPSCPTSLLPAGDEGMTLLCMVFFYNWDFTGVLIVMVCFGFIPPHKLKQKYWISAAFWPELRGSKSGHLCEQEKRKKRQSHIFLQRSRGRVKSPVRTWYWHLPLGVLFAVGGGLIYQPVPLQF